MDYERKYKEAQKWIESIYSELSHEQQMEAEAFFPELKESEDERIRKSIIKFLIDVNNGAYTKSELEIASWITWLEKQSNKNTKVTLPTFTFEDVLALECSMKTAKITKGGDKLYEMLVSLYDKIHNAYLLEKQGEEEPTDKVEPKFKVGDWVVTSYGKVNQVIAVDEDGDGFTLDDDTYFSGSWKDGYHLWTIQDAKDGDVIVASDGSLFILAKVKDNSAYYHFSLWKNGSKEISDGNHSLENAKGCHPATKEQRTELFLKMHEAGYEWDTEKKELKKISQRMVSAEAKEALYDKPVWSEEDETGWTNTMIMIKEVASNHYTKDSIKLVIDWLKSLKDRVQPKQEWSEEDEEFLRRAINVAKDKYPMTANWLKSLKQRIGWKPSAGQMKALHDLNLAGNISYAGQGQILIELYNDLKKLTE